MKYATVISWNRLGLFVQPWTVVFVPVSTVDKLVHGSLGTCPSWTAFSSVVWPCSLACSLLTRPGAHLGVLFHREMRYQWSVNLAGKSDRPGINFPQVSFLLVKYNIPADKTWGTFRRNAMSVWPFLDWISPAYSSARKTHLFCHPTFIRNSSMFWVSNWYSIFH